MKIQLIANIKVPQAPDASVSLGYLFPAGTDVTIGREIGNTIAPLVDSLSRHHAKLYAKDGAWYVEDVGSTNGSFLNGTKIEGATKLESGAKLQFGMMTLSVELLADASATAPIPAMALSPGATPSSMTPAEAAAAGAAADAAGTLSATNAPTIVRKPTIPGISPLGEQSKPVLPATVNPIEPPKATPVAEVADIADIPDLPPVDDEKPAAAASAEKPGLKLPPKPALGSGIKLPPKPALGSGIKLPPKKPALGAGLKLPPKPGLGSGLKLPPKPGLKLPPK